MSFLPRSTFDELDKINRNFVWGESDRHKKIHLVAWNDLCKPKVIGGLGLRSVGNVNKTFMMKAD